MGRNDAESPRDPERKRAGRTGPESARREAREPRANGWAPHRGRSGYGVESIRPHLRAELEYQRLMRPTFPPQDPDEDKPNGED